MALVRREHAKLQKSSSSSRKAKPSPSRGSFLDSMESTDKEMRTHGESILVFGSEGSGKTSMLAYADNVVFVCGQQEHGIHKLKRSGLVPKSVAIGRDAETWYDLLNIVDEIAEGDHEYKFVAFDSLSVFQQLCFEQCCKEEYDNDFSKEGFLSFMQGPRTAAIKYWPDFLRRLDNCRERGIHVGLIAHANIQPYKNPEGPDFDRFVPDLSGPIWKATSKWADSVFYLAHSTSVEKDGKYSRFKGEGGQQRIVYTEYCAAHDGKNRFGLPAVLGPYDDAESTWRGTWGRIRKALSGTSTANGSVKKKQRD